MKCLSLSCGELPDILAGTEKFSETCNFVWQAWSMNIALWAAICMHTYTERWRNLTLHVMNIVFVGMKLIGLQMF